MKVLTLHVDHASIGGEWVPVTPGEIRLELPNLPIDRELAAARQELVVERQRTALELARLKLRIERLERVPWWRWLRGRQR